MPGKRGPVEERFWSKVDKSGGPDACWIWTGSKDKDGYGRISSPWRPCDLAHRVSYRLAHGSVPEGLDVCHTCDNPSCVNPKHSFVGTRKENLQDAARKGRIGKIGHEKRRGTGNGRSKLRDADVLAIRAARNAGENFKSLAARFGVSDSAIEFIVNRKHWAHI